MLISLFVFILEYWPDRNDAASGLLSDEQAAALQQENKRQQIVSYGMPHLIDTVNLRYVIPTAVQTLDRPEESVMEVLDMFPSKSYRTKEMYYSSARFTNLLIYDAKNNQVSQLFSQRVLIGMFHPAYFNDDIFLLFLFADKDTNNDGSINLDDYTTLGVYSFNNKELLRISQEDCCVGDYMFVENSKDLLIMLGIDRDKNGEFHSSKEPSVVKFYHYQNRMLTDIIPKDMQENLQQLVEGRNVINNN